MTYQICTYGNPALRQKAEKITTIDDSIRKLADEMLLIMKKVNGVGLAAQQIDKHIQICVVHIPVSYDISEDDGSRLNPDIEMPLILINPLIISSKGRHTLNESCLSIPGISAPVQRALEIKVAYRDLDGKDQETAFKGFLARAIQHEIDHLNGMLFVDRVSPVKKITLSTSLKRLQKKTEEQK